MIFGTLGKDNFSDNMSIFGVSFADTKKAFSDVFSEVTAGFDESTSKATKFKETIFGVERGIKAAFVKPKESPFDIMDDETATKWIERFAKDTDKGAEAIQKFNVELKDKGMKEYLKTVSAGSANLEGYKNYINQTNTALQKTSLSAKAASAGMKALAIAENMLITMGISIAIEALISGISHLINYQKESIQAFEDITTEWKKQANQLDDARKTINELSSEYKNLSSGVDQFGNNISLTANQYERYNEISEKFTSIFPGLIQYHTDITGAIVAEKIGVEDLNKAYESLDLYNRMEILKNADDAYQGYLAKFKKGLKTDPTALPFDDTHLADQLYVSKEIIDNINNAEKLVETLKNLDAQLDYIEILKDAGLNVDSVKVYGQWDEQAEYIQNNISKILSLYKNAVNEANQDTQKIKPIVSALLADDYTYQTFDTETQKIVDNIISKFDYQFFSNFQGKNAKVDMYQWIQDNLLSPLYDPKTSNEVKQALSTLLTQDTRNQSYSQYKQTMQNALDALPKNLREKVKVYFDIEVDSEERYKKIESWEKKLGIDNLEDELSKDQIDLLLNPDFKFTGNTLDALKKALNEELGDNPVDVSITLGDTMTDISSLTESYELIQAVKEELAETGNISAETLSSMQDKYEDLTGPISLFNAGLITSEELILALSNAYEADKTNFENSINSKILSLPEFYNSLGENQKQAIDDLAESYNVDLSNFKTVEGKKLNFQAEIIQKLANNYAKYSGKTLEDLKLQRSKLGSYIESQKDFATKYGPPGKFGQFVIPFSSQVEYNALDSTITEIENFNNRLDDIVAGNLETYTFDPTKYIKPEKSKSGKSKDKDAWLEDYEKERAQIDHEHQMDLMSTAEYRDKLVALDNKYFVGREKYLDKHQKIQEEIYELDKGFVQDELGLLSDLEGTEEEKIKAYNKLISIANAEIERALNEGIVDSSDYIKGLRKDVSDAEKAIEDLNQKIFSRDMDDMSFSADMLSKRQDTEGKRISIYREMQNKIIQEMDRAEANGIESNKEYLQELEKQWWDLADSINSVLETLGDKLSEKIDEKIQELEKANERLEQDQSDWEAAIGYATSVIDKRIEAIQKEKEALEDANDERDRAIELEKLQTALENAKNQKNVRVYYEDLGFVWEADQSAIEEAQKNLDDFNKESQLLEKDKEIKYWESEKEKWESIVSDYETEQNRLIAIQQFGEDITQKILAGQSDALVENARQHYIATSDKIKDNKREIESLNELQENVTAFVDKQIEDNDRLTVNMMDNKDKRKEIWNQMLSDAKYFVSEYNSIMDSISTGDYDSANNSATQTYLWKGQKVDTATVNKWKNDGWVYVGSANGGTWSKNGKNSFASGTHNAPGGLSIVDENGREAILSKLSSGRFEFLGKGDQVFTSEQTKRLWEWAQNTPSNFFNSLRKSFGFLDSRSVVNKTESMSFYIDRVVLKNVNNPQEMVSQLKRYAITHSNL